MKSLVLYTVLLCCPICCCKRKEDPVFLPTKNCSTSFCTENSLYYPLTKGSYWIYERSTHHLDDDSRIIDSYDSCYVPYEDTIIDGQIYSFRITTRFLLPSYNVYTYKNYHRYAGDYVLSGKDYKLFSACSTNEILATFSQGLYSTELRSTNRDTLYTVPAGTFESRIEENRYFIPHASPSGNGEYYTQYIFYSKNIGVIYDATPYSSNANILDEKRLIRYHVQ